MSGYELSKEAAEALEALDASEDELHGAYINRDDAAAEAALRALDSDSGPDDRQVLLDNQAISAALDALDSSDADSQNASEPRRFNISRPTSATESRTHHNLDDAELGTFEYPIDMEVRDYQRNIIRKALTQNLICALPTGLGKTFIASVVMMNWYRWTRSSKLLFVAPTRPLVAQQVESFLQMSGISIHETAALLQSVVDKKGRTNEWKTKRVFFATAQTVENDLRQGIVNPSDFVLVVMDEAHRATGNHSYVNVVRMIRDANPSFRVLALTATPSGKIDGVQQIIDTLGISATEIRSEESLDIQKYVHSRQVEKVVVEPSQAQIDLMALADRATKEQMRVLQQAGIVSQNISVVHPFMLQQETRRYMTATAARFNNGRRFQIQAIAGLMSKVAYATMLLRNHGIVPFYSRMHQLELELMGSNGINAKKLLTAPGFSDISRTCRKLIYGNDKGPTYKYEESERVPSFIGHSKLEYLVDIINNFQRDRSADSRIIVFAEYRDSAAEILWILGRHSPQIVNASLFVGQATSNKAVGVKGMTQKEQQEILTKFKGGQINVLVATSIGEEGLDIGQVDLIICYDQSQSPIRNIQRMGRTGRKRNGSVYMLMTAKEESKLSHAFDGHRFIRDRIYQSSGSVSVNVADTLRLRYVPSKRIIPLEFEPKYKEVNIEIPPENEAALASGDVITAMKDLSKAANQTRLSFKRKPPAGGSRKKRNTRPTEEEIPHIHEGFRSASDCFEAN